VNSDITLLLNGEAGIAGGYGGKELPFFKNFYAGGPGSVRGYDSSSLGPRDSAGLVLGGPRRVVGGAELMTPFPGMDKEKSVRLSGFIDAGAVFGPGDQPGSAGLRYSAGMAFTWLSPVGPLKFSYAWPLNKQSVDKVQKFQFTLGSIF
jgi:outer membrane protein insertion porin family